MNIEQFILEEAQKPFEWGDTDCCSTANRWVFTRTGFNCLNEYNRPLLTEKEARDWLDEENLIKAVKKVMRESPFSLTNKPKQGDIGIVLIDSETIAMAIHTGTNWFTRNEKGMIAASLNTRVFASWSIECLK